MGLSNNLNRVFCAVRSGIEKSWLMRRLGPRVAADRHFIISTKFTYNILPFIVINYLKI